MKPILATDANLDKIKYPVMAFPKIDGVRALVNSKGTLVGRSGKQFKNKWNTKFFSQIQFAGLDGEMVTDRITGDGLCNETTSALTTIGGMVPTRYCVFDYIIDGFNNHEPYHIRYQQLLDVVHNLHNNDTTLYDRIWVIDCRICDNRQQIEEWEDWCIGREYEGLILRDPNAPYKYGRSTASKGEFLRLKRFLDAEIVVTKILEGQSNQNDLKYNPNGYAERSTHAANMVPNGMVGSILGTAVQDVVWKDRVLIKAGAEVEIAPGKMTHNDRRKYYENPDLILGKIAKYQFFPVGFKDKPRFPTFQGLRDPVDM